MTDRPVTLLLDAWQNGNQQALAELSNVIYKELQRIAGNYMKAERADHTLQATALVNEAFVRLIPTNINYKNRTHFLTLAGRTMRRILVDHARSAMRDKRGGGVSAVTLYESRLEGKGTSPDILTLNAALESLAEFDLRKAQVMELQYFAGLNAEQIAEALGVSKRTAERDAQLARAWLQRKLAEGA